MAVLLLSVPRSGAENDGWEVELGAISAVLGPKYSQSPELLEPCTASGGLFAVWHDHEIGSGIYEKSGVWVASTTPPLNQKIKDGTSHSIHGLEIDPAVGGSYMAIRGNLGSDRIWAWSTPPAVEPVYYGQTDSHTYVSNRPLPVAMAIYGGDTSRFSMSDQFIEEYLNYGFSISEVTPFQGVYMLKPRQALSISSGEVYLHAEPDFGQPTLKETDDPREMGAEELKGALLDATGKLLSQRPNRPVQLRLSGGRDSRLILALLNHFPEVDVTCVTQGDSKSEQVKIASALASMANREFIATAPNMTDRDSIVRSCERTIFESSGSIPSEPTIAPFSAPDALSEGEYLAAGEWPLFRGFLERTSKRSAAAVEDALNASSKELLSEEGNLSVSRTLNRWKASVPALSSYEMLYFYGRDIRASRYQQAKLAQVDTTSKVFYPFMDVNVVRLSDVLPVVNRRMQYTVFALLRDLWPESFSIPYAFDEPLRFERFEGTRSFSDGYRASKSAKDLSYAGDVVQSSQRASSVDSSFYSAPISSASNLVVTSTHWGRLKELLNADFASNVEQWATCENDRNLPGVPQVRGGAKEIKIKVWRVMMIVLWLEKRWAGYIGNGWSAKQ